MFDAGGTAVPGDVAGLGGLAAPAAAAAALDASGLTDDDLMAVVGDLEGVRRRIDAAIAHAVGELDARRVTDAVHGHGTAAWLDWTSGLPRAECARRVRVAGFLRRHPVLDAALQAGEISMDHVTALARLCTPRVAHCFDDLEAHLVALAGGVRFETWARVVAALLDLADQDGGHEPRPEDNRLRASRGLDGAVHLDGDLLGIWGEETLAALDAEADRLFHSFRRDADATDGELPVPPRPALLALALVGLVRAGRAALHPGSGPVADVTLVIRDEDPGRVTTADGTPVEPTTAATFCCDPVVHDLVVDHHGDPLHLGRARRLASPDQRRAAAVRDGGCCFLGCDLPPSWTDLHHVTYWADGGPTDLDNLVSLCRHHHGVVHRRGWSVRRVEGQRFRITSAAGRSLPCQRHGQAVVTGRRGPPG